MDVTGILFYILLGVLMALAAVYVYGVHRKTALDWQSWAYAISAILLAPFGLAWAYMSLLEGEPQAAVMGIAMFTGSGVFFAFLSWWRARPEAAENERSIEKPSLATLTPSKIAAIAFFVLFVFTLPVALWVNAVGGALFSSEQAGTLAINSVTSDKALPKAIKKALVKQVRYGAEDFTLEQRLMLNMTGSVDEKEWVALFDMVIPEKVRIELTQQSILALFAWLDNDQSYPELVAPVGQYFSALESRAEELVPWIYDSMLFPYCTEEQEARYARGEFGSDLEGLITCRPAAESRARLIPHTADLLRKQLQSQVVPDQVSLSEELGKAQLSAETMGQYKKKINTLRTISQSFWILPLLLLAGALACVARSVKDLALWLKWPLLATGLLGLLLTKALTSQAGFVAHALKTPPAEAPVAAYSIVETFLTALMLQAGETLFAQMAVAAVVGAVLLLLPLLKRRLKGLNEQ